MSLNKFSHRAMLRRPGRTLLTLASIVIGVCAVVSVNIIATTTRSAYKQMFGMVTGRAALEVAPDAAGKPFSDEVVETVSKVTGVRVAAPAVQQLCTMYANKERVTVQALGVDPKLDREVRDYRVKSGRDIESGREIVVDEAFARRLNLKVDDEVKLLTRSGLQTMTVVGLLEPRSGNALRHAGVVLLPLPTMQAAFSSKRKVNLVQLVLDDAAVVETVQAEVQALLPQGVSVRAPAASSQVMKETLVGSEKGLLLTTVFVLLLAVFIILNTFLMNVSERRRQLAILRAIGATRWQVMFSLVRESLILGVVGTVIGIVLGLVMASFVCWVLSVALGLTLPSIQITTFPFVLAVIVGFAISVLGSLWPAYRATTVSPLEGLDRAPRGDLGRLPLSLPLTGVSMIVVGLTAALLSIFGKIPDIIPIHGESMGVNFKFEFDVAVAAGALVLVGLVAAYPFILIPATKLLLKILPPLLGNEVGLALRQILRHKTRSSLTAGVMFVAGSTGLAVSNSILDNVNDVRDWYHQAIVGDFFIRAMMPDMATGMAADLPEELGRQLKAMPALTGQEALSLFDVVMVLPDGEEKMVGVSREYLETERLPFDLVEGDARGLYQKMMAGQVVIGSVTAQRFKLHAGGEITLKTLTGNQTFSIAAVTNDYLGGGLSIYFHRDLAVQRMGVEGVDVWVLTANKADIAATRVELEKLCDSHGVLLHSFDDISAQINTMIFGIDGFLWGLVALEFVVAAFGVVNTLTMSVLEQTREIGLLRIVAMTQRQVRRTILSQALVIGAIGLLPGVIVGVGLAIIFNWATLEAVGHTIEFGFHPWLVAATLFGSLLIVALASWIPAQRAARLDMVQALHYE